jgi:hypothetical protein
MTAEALPNKNPHQTEEERSQRMDVGKFMPLHRLI